MIPLKFYSLLRCGGCFFRNIIVRVTTLDIILIRYSLSSLIKFKFFNKFTISKNLIGSVIILFYSNIAFANDSFEYNSIAESHQYNEAKQFSLIFHYALNNNGDVAFQAARRFNSTFINGLYRGNGIEVLTVLEPDGTGFPQVSSQSNVGINDDGLIAGRAVDEFSNSGVWTISSEGIVKKIEGAVSDLSSALDINNSGQIAARRNLSANDIIISDGIVEENIGGYPRTAGSTSIVVNDVGQAAHLYIDGGVQNPVYIARYESGIIAKVTPITAPDGARPRDENNMIGFNNLGNMTINTGAGTGSDGRILFVSDNGIFVVAEVEDDFFTDFYSGTSLNDNNIVAFIASFDDNGSNRKGIFMRAHSDIPYIEVLREGDILNNQIVVDFNGLDTEALNESGQIAFIAHLADGSRLLVRADPKPGVIPDVPIVPDPEDRIDDGFDMSIPNITRSAPPSTVRTYFDPPMTIGYDYSVNDISPSIESILITAPLPEGDDTFFLHFEGQTYTLKAEAPFYFTDFMPEGVRSFTLDGIDETEMLDPSDPRAFVAGLTFVDFAVEGSMLKMIPIVTGDEESDLQPPVVTGIYASTNPIAQYTTFYINAVVDDRSTGGSNIHSANYTLNSGASVEMSAVDGAFDSATENVVGPVGAGLAAGVYSICVTGVDAIGLSSSPECSFLAVYDPSAGFVTGGGWINSPAGALTAAPSMGGRADFGFVSKYKKGATVPDGDTEFLFKAVDLSFRSTSYDWLVISGNRAQFKGEGTINDSGNYKFMLTAIDEGNGEGVDRFRIKITDPDDNVVYDNQLGNRDDAALSTAISGGQIVIHTKGKK